MDPPLFWVVEPPLVPLPAEVLLLLGPVLGVVVASAG
jgi:hypothetical protein